MKDIVIIANFCDGPNENTNNRFNYLAKLFSESNSKVELITSNYSHRLKKKRESTKYSKDLCSYKITMLHEPSYKKNISIKRFYAHKIFSLKVKEYLKEREKPDVIYCAIPSLDVGKVVYKYAKSKGIKLIIDVQDLWPEAFKMAFNIPVVSDLIFYPLKIKADKIYRNADKIVAVSDTYLNKILQINPNGIGQTVYLGTDLKDFDKLAEENKFYKSDDEFWITYIGTLGHSYDIKLVIDALEIVNNRGVKGIKFILIGDGPLKDKFENYASDKNVNVNFVGKLEYAKMVGRLVESDIAVNPIIKGAAGSIINKVGDYAAAGLAVLNTQDCKEYCKLLEKWNAGINSLSGNPVDLANNIIKLYSDNNLRLKMGRNNRKLAENKFDRNESYKKILEFL
ncbi:glycosyltransferase family 4 protein [Clostridium perfringens]|uniref:glycosyltransferase family 4 protein n=1 Tax=Clostridium perfringens TaxID=1502 RepID=UPI0013E3F412|nr:glycosyltransferase family 4 protein [Clostridium perfringens]NGU52989.1 glycosyltransferase family 4 protein [Clostridium perfringens]